MTSKKTLNAKNLETLGAARLAELLIEISTGDAAAKRRLRLELAGAQSSDEVAREVRKRLATIGRSRGFIDWQKRKALIDDLETQRRAIVDHIAKDDAAEALELIWRFLMLSNPVLSRSEDVDGVLNVFGTACQDLGRIAATVGPDPVSLAERAFDALSGNDDGQFDDLIEILAPALGGTGLGHLKTLFVQLSKEPVPTPPDAERQVLGWTANGPLYADDYAQTRRDSTVRRALMDIADAQGDVDAYIALHSEKARTVPDVAARIARRLLAANRPDEARAAVDVIDENRPGLISFDWEQTRIDVLDAQERTEEAQAFRLKCFERSLNTSHLRAYLKRLPDFDDIEAEEAALLHALAHRSVLTALMFLTTWPALDRAAELVLTRWEEIDGNHYEVIGPAADALDAKHPLAATVLRRSMIDFALDKARASRYRHAARHLSQCASLAREITDPGRFGTHDAYLARLRAQHSRKTAFWSLVT